MKRRSAIKAITLMAGAKVLNPFQYPIEYSMTRRVIPSSGELLPVLGIGTWQTFDVGQDQDKKKELTSVLKKMNEMGGAVIDSSPMYGKSEEVVGDLTNQLSFSDEFFYATKVWTTGKQSGINQMKRSFELMRRKTMDLMQIHNLVDWEVHMKTLKEWKEEGKIRYWGITHYTNASHKSLATIIRKENPDFVQFNYAINDRHAEDHLLGVAKDHGTAVIINRPFGGGGLFSWARNKLLPEWCKDHEIHSWAQFFLKYIIAHPAVTCVIPGTGKLEHAIDNLKAGYKVTEGQEFQKKLLATFNSL
ncbi:aldo/keto reductase [Portibacter marinus]|uniref:aldo/keto reductase n=1 Tax=Portibacter marinus TaxID=2898660 RepID=UPI001F1B450A|nr:aldo/keto reductase [Portibacter marinus]